MHNYKFIIDCLPPSVNGIYKRTRYGGVFKSQRARDFEQIAGYQLKKISTPLTGNLHVKIEFRFKSKARCGIRDLDNMLKLTFDLLADNRIIENDNQIVHLVCSKDHSDKDQIFGEIW